MLLHEVNSMNDIEIRTATENDAEQMLGIYAYYVQNTAITFEYEVPALEEFKKRISDTLKIYPYLCILQNGTIMGYAYAGKFKDRAAYDWSVEMTVYIDFRARKCGLGRKIYEALENALREMGIFNLYACIAYPSSDDEYLTKNSAEFHEHLGYKKIGEFHNCGFKFNRWYNMIWMEKIIGDHKKKPGQIKKYSEIKK